VSEIPCELCGPRRPLQPLVADWMATCGLIANEWVSGCADTSGVVKYTMGGCVSCEFTWWCHGSKGVT